MSDPLVLFTTRDGVGWLTLNRPGALNALKPPDTLQAFHRIFAQVSRDPAIKALVITGAGEDAFCIGTDVDFLGQAFDTRNFHLFRDYLESINDVFFALEDLPVPTIAMVQGKARAGGFELILACDFVIMANEAQIGDVHTPYGHMPGAGSTQRLARKIGMQRAMELILTGRWLTGPDAAVCGLALRSVPRAELRQATEEFTSRLTDKTRDSLRHVKRALLRGWDLPLRDGVRLEVQSYIEYLATSTEPSELFRINQDMRRARKRQE